jgi:hypothetical protein
MNEAAKPTERAMRAAVNLEVQEPWLKYTEHTAEELDKSFPAYDDMLAALQALAAKFDPAALVENDLRHSDLADEMRAVFAALLKAGHRT